MPILGASAVVLRGDEVLLIKRSDIPVWALPGGGVDAHESCASAAIREVREETGIEIELTGLIGVYSRPLWRFGGDHAMVFVARPLTTEFTIQVEEVTDVGFFPTESLPQPFVWWQRIVDAIDGVVGVCRVQECAWPYEEGEQGYQKARKSAASPAAMDWLINAPPKGEIIETHGVKSRGLK